MKNYKYIIFAFLVTGCLGKPVKKQNFQRLNIVNEEFREFQYVKEIWKLSESVNTQFRLNNDESDELSVIKTNYLNEITKQNPDPKHVYYWEDPHHRFAVKYVLIIKNDIANIDARFDFLVPPAQKCQEKHVANSSFRLQSCYHLDKRKKMNLNLDQLSTETLSVLNSFISQQLNN